MTGQQALRLLQSEALAQALQTHPVPVLAEGRIGLIGSARDGSIETYIRELQEAGAVGAFVGGGLVRDGQTSTEVMQSLQLGWS